MSGLEDWLKWDPDAASRDELVALERTNRSEFDKRMSPRIAFGTAGLRAAMGPGFALMNKVTVLQASQGLAKYVEGNVEHAKERGVVIGHDHRHNSDTFAALTALAFSHLGFTVHFLGRVHTPSVPFTIDSLRAACGVMVTASHNPARDNGYKVYWSNGCQIIPPHDAGIAREIEANLEPWTWNLSSIKSVTDNPIDVLEDYFEQFQDLKFGAPKPAKFVYTPLHGVGLPYVQHAAQILGCLDQMIVVEEQAEPDPDFSTVKFPNPEEKGALDLSYEWADKHGAQVVLANDPDADRFACAVKHENQWVQLKGDQVGTLLADFLLTRAKPGRAAVLNSTVSSQMLRYLAEHHNARYEETLTGFKWLGNKAIELEEEGYIVALAYEEALGYECGKIHDKDGVSALFVVLQLLQLVPSAHAELDRLSGLVGHFSQYNSYYIVDPSRARQVFARIRDTGTEQIGPLKVTAWRDLTTGYDSEQPDHKPVLPVSKSSDMITAVVDADGGSARFTVRGSGTEPKIKVYIEARAQSLAQAAAIAKLVWDTLGAHWFTGETAESA